MSKYMRAVVCLVLLATIVGALSAQDDAICESLRAIHATHGDSLAAYLSEKGENCLEPATTPTLAPTTTSLPTITPEPLNEVIWSSNDVGDKQGSVSLQLTRGVYELGAPRPAAAVEGGYAWLGDIISIPDSCVYLNHVTFPATLKITHKECSVHATLEVQLPWEARHKSWKFTITKVSDMLPRPPLADGWSFSGYGYSHQPIEVRFARGLYRVTKHRGPSVALLGIPSSDQSGSCLGRRVYELPTQFKVDVLCTLKGGIKIGNSYGRVGSWSYSITKLD